MTEVRRSVNEKFKFPSESVDQKNISFKDNWGAMNPHIWLSNICVEVTSMMKDFLHGGIHLE
jgi:hypothetical protein